MMFYFVLLLCLVGNNLDDLPGVFGFEQFAH